MVIDQCNSRQCTQFILPTFDNWREWLILLQSTRMVDSDICIDKIGWFYPNRESTFWTMHAILELHIPILAMRNNKMGHRINKMWTLINKVGHRNVKLVDTYQQVGFKKQQNGSRVLYRQTEELGFLIVGLLSWITVQTEWVVNVIDTKLYSVYSIRKIRHSHGQRKVRYCADVPTKRWIDVGDEDSGCYWQWNAVTAGLVSKISINKVWRVSWLDTCEMDENFIIKTSISIGGGLLGVSNWRYLNLGDNYKIQPAEVF